MSDRFFSYDGETFATHATLTEAREESQKAIDHFRGEAGFDGEWADEVARVCWGEIRERAEALPDEESEDDEPRCDYALAPTNPGERPALTRAAADVLAEREKQRAKWGDDHDDTHTNPPVLPLTAAVLAIEGLPGVPWSLNAIRNDSPEWVRSLVDRHGPRARLVIAAALLLAEIERLDRAAATVVDAPEVAPPAAPA